MVFRKIPHSNRFDFFPHNKKIYVQFALKENHISNYIIDFFCSIRVVQSFIKFQKHDVGPELIAVFQYYIEKIQSGISNYNHQLHGFVAVAHK